MWGYMVPSSVHVSPHAHELTCSHLITRLEQNKKAGNSATTTKTELSDGGERCQ